MKKTIIPNSLDRIYAFILDYCIFCSPNIALLGSFCVPWANIIFPDNGPWPLLLLIFYAFPWLLLIAILSLGMISFLFLLFYCLIFSIFYFYFDSKKWGTPGKKNKGIMLCNLDNSNLSLLKAFARNFIKFFFFVCCPFVLLPFWGGGTQGLHDKICGTKVITAPPPTTYKTQKMPHGFKNAQKSLIQQKNK